MKIGIKITIGFLAVVAIFAIFGYSIYLNEKSIETVTSHFSDEIVIELNTLQELKSSTLTVLSTTMEIVLIMDERNFIEQQQQQQTNVTTDFSPKEGPVDVGLHTHRSRTDKSAKNKVRDGGVDPPRGSSPTHAWSPEIATLIEWFLAMPPPTEPFELQQGVTVLRPEGLWDYLKGDIAAGPGKARACTGAFQKDLRRLVELFGGPAQTEKR